MKEKLQKFVQIPSREKMSVTNLRKKPCQCSYIKNISLIYKNERSSWQVKVNYPTRQCLIVVVVECRTRTKNQDVNFPE